MRAQRSAACRLARLLMACLLVSSGVSEARPKDYPPQGEIPLVGYPIGFSDPPGPYTYKTEIVRYQSADGASIEATLVIPQADRARPGLVFVHMWARDRNTFWGLPEYLATYGYSSIYMDLRGHGNSHYPDSEMRTTLLDKNRKYADLEQDILPAIALLNGQEGVKRNGLILVGASLGSPLGVLAVEKNPEKFIGMIHLSPSTNYFDVDCRRALKRLRRMPTYVIAEATDKSFHGAKLFFNLLEDYKVFLQLDHVGHGSNGLFYDLGIPTVIRQWVEEIEALSPVLTRLKEARPLKSSEAQKPRR